MSGWGKENCHDSLFTFLYIVALFYMVMFHKWIQSYTLIHNLTYPFT